MTTGFAMEQLHILKEHALCKATTQSPALISHFNLKENTISKSSIRSDDLYTDKSTTAGLREMIFEIYLKKTCLNQFGFLIR